MWQKDAARNAAVAQSFRAHKPDAFRAQRSSAGKREAKRAWLEALGWSVHYFYYDADYETEVRRLQTFLAAHGIIVSAT